MTPLEFASACLAYCHMVRGSVTSWGRTAQRNALVGGHPESRHLVWLAMDVVPNDAADPPPGHRATMGRKLGLNVILEDDHDHLQPL